MMNTKDKLVILIVEDYDLHRTILANMLRSMGFVHIIETQDGFEALEACEKNGIDILFCDLRLPSMDGMALLRRLASKGFKGSIILFSALENDVVDAVLRMSDLLGLQVLGRANKPTTLQQLQVLIDGWSPREEITPVKIQNGNITVPDLEYAIQHAQLETWYQPKVSFISGKWCGVEVLCRWTHPIYGVVSPDFFIPLAEKNGLMHQLTEMIIQDALANYHSYTKGVPKLNISLNLSTSSLIDKKLSNFLLLHCAINNIKPELITLEITESVFTEDIGQALEVLSRLRMHGFGISIDDFGTGYSSLQQLALLPFTELKLDRTFVERCHSTPSSMIIIESSIKLANKLGLTTVAEGVEDKVTWDLLRKLGCHTCQGYVVARAMPFNELSDWHQSWKLKSEELISDS